MFSMNSSSYKKDKNIITIMYIPCYYYNYEYKMYIIVYLARWLREIFRVIDELISNN